MTKIIYTDGNIEGVFGTPVQFSWKQAGSFMVWLPEGFVITPRTEEHPDGLGAPWVDWQTGEPVNEHGGTPGGPMREAIVNKKRNNNYPDYLLQKSIVEEGEKAAPRFARVSRLNFIPENHPSYQAHKVKGVRQFDSYGHPVVYEEDSSYWFLHRPEEVPYPNDTLEVVYQLTNEFRVEQGRTPLLRPIRGYYNMGAESVIRQNSRYKGLAHSSYRFDEGYVEIYERVVDASMPPIAYGENILVQSDSIDTTEYEHGKGESWFVGWKNSPPHRANMLYEWSFGPEVFPPLGGVGSLQLSSRSGADYEWMQPSPYVTGVEVEEEPVKNVSYASQVFWSMDRWVYATSLYTETKYGVVSWPTRDTARYAPVPTHYTESYARVFFKGRAFLFDIQARVAMGWACTQDGMLTLKALLVRHDKVLLASLPVQSYIQDTQTFVFDTEWGTVTQSNTDQGITAVIAQDVSAEGDRMLFTLVRKAGQIDSFISSRQPDFSYDNPADSDTHPLYWEKLEHHEVGPSGVSLIETVEPLVEVEAQTVKANEQFYEDRVLGHPSNWQLAWEAVLHYRYHAACHCVYNMYGRYTANSSIEWCQASIDFDYYYGDCHDLSYPVPPHSFFSGMNVPDREAAYNFAFDSLKRLMFESEYDSQGQAAFSIALAPNKMGGQHLGNFRIIVRQDQATVPMYEIGHSYTLEKQLIPPDGDPFVFQKMSSTDAIVHLYDPEEENYIMQFHLLNPFSPVSSSYTKIPLNEHVYEYGNSSWSSRRTATKGRASLYIEGEKEVQADHDVNWYFIEPGNKSQMLLELRGEEWIEVENQPSLVHQAFSGVWSSMLLRIVDYTYYHRSTAQATGYKLGVSYLIESHNIAETVADVLSHTDWRRGLRQVLDTTGATHTLELPSYQTIPRQSYGFSFSSAMLGLSWGDPRVHDHQGVICCSGNPYVVSDFMSSDKSSGFRFGRVEYQGEYVVSAFYESFSAPNVWGTSSVLWVSDEGFKPATPVKMSKSSLDMDWVGQRVDPVGLL